MSEHAPVTDLAAHRRRLGIALACRRLGCPTERITATRNDHELDELYHREKLIADLVRLGGSCRAVLDLHNTDTLEEMRRACLQDLMGAPDRGTDPHILAFPGRGHRYTGDRTQRCRSTRRAEHRAWDLPSDDAA